MNKILYIYKNSWSTLFSALQIQVYQINSKEDSSSLKHLLTQLQEFER